MSGLFACSPRKAKPTASRWARPSVGVLVAVLSLAVLPAAWSDGPQGGGSGSDNGGPANAAPRIEDFVGEEGPGRVWTFTGRVVDEAPGGLTVTFGGIPSLAGQTTITAADGSFSKTVVLQPGEEGYATAVTVDAAGLSSNVARYFVSQTLP